MGARRLYDHDLIYAMLDNGVTQKCAAKIVGTSQQYLNRLAVARRRGVPLAQVYKKASSHLGKRESLL